MKILAFVLGLLLIGPGALVQAADTAEAHREQAEKLKDQLRQQKEKYDEVKLRARQHKGEGNAPAAAKDRAELNKLRAQIRETKYKIKQERRKARHSE